MKFVKRAKTNNQGTGHHSSNDGANFKTQNQNRKTWNTVY